MGAEEWALGMSKTLKSGSRGYNQGPQLCGGQVQGPF